MDDDLRKLVDVEDFLIKEEPSAASQPAAAGSSRRFLGMTPPQRFIIAVMIFVLTFILGSFVLITSGKVVLPL